MGDVVDGVHSGISPSGTTHLDLFAAKCAEGFFEFFLNGNGVVLNLPSAECA